MSGPWSDRPVLEWLPEEDRLCTDLSELADADAELERECRRLGEALKAHVVAYRAGARARPTGLCARFRFAELDQEQAEALHEAELQRGGIIFVAYARPLARW